MIYVKTLGRTAANYETLKDLRRFIHPVVNWNNKAMHLYSNNEVRSGSRCCRGKAISITHFVCVSVFLPHLSGI